MGICVYIYSSVCLCDLKKFTVSTWKAIAISETCLYVYPRL